MYRRGDIVFFSESILNIADDIFLKLLTGIAIIFFLVFLLSRGKILTNIMLKRDTGFREQAILACIFGIIGIIGTYYGFPVADAIANTRAIGPLVGGLIAGPYVGLGAGVIAGAHRFIQGGFTVWPSSLSTVFEGLAAGLYYKKIRHKRDRWTQTIIIAFVLETLHMGFLIIGSRPLEQSLKLVGIIGPPMILINSLGTGAFVAILDSVYHVQEEIEGKAAQLALKIANKTLPFLRKGLNMYSAGKTAQIIYEMVQNVAAVAITSHDQILAFKGAGSDHHLPGTEIKTLSTRYVVEKGEYSLVQAREEIGCPYESCPLASKVAVPLKENQEVVGTLVLYKTTENSITVFEKELALGLAQLISTQIEISKGERKNELLAQAEIRALQAQINPHFLFNALNTIVFYCRKEPETARELLISLGDFYRNNLAKLENLVDLSTELKHVASYVQIEMARFAGKLQVIYNIDPRCDTCRIPPLILQPIVENAIKHGVLPRKEGGKVVISAKIADERVYLTVEDNGVGMPEELVKKVLEYDPRRKNIGLCNVHSRLKNIYGINHGLTIRSCVGVGTEVVIEIPMGKEDKDEAEGSPG